MLRLSLSSLLIVAGCGDDVSAGSDAAVDAASDASSVVEPYEMAGDRLATAALRPHTSAYLDQVFSTESDKVELTEGEIDSRSELVGSTLSDAEAKAGVVLVAFRRNGEHDFQSASAFTGVLDAGDVVITLGDRSSVIKLSELAGHRG